MKSFVVYRFSCPGCNARYIGETTRHLNKRIEEHFTNKSSHIFMHLQKSQNCKQICNNECFKIIDCANSAFGLKVKEAMHIGWEKPSLNVQQMTVQVTITVWFLFLFFVMLSQLKFVGSVQYDLYSWYLLVTYTMSYRIMYLITNNVT